MPDDSPSRLIRAILLRLESVVTGVEHVATGASSDFENATATASQIVKYWGMSNAAGTRTYGEVISALEWGN